MTAQELLPKIKPRNIKRSDKYSANLFAFVRATEMTTVVLHKPTGGRFIAYYNWKEDGWNVLTGARIGAILSNVRSGASDGFTAVYLGLFTKDCEDITETFWRDYIRIGRCIFDPDHSGWMQGDENRFTVVKGTRRCNWCGKWFRRSIEKVVVVKRREVWTPLERG